MKRKVSKGNLRKTPILGQILAFLGRERLPVSAGDIRQHLPQLDKVTVYRTLERLVRAQQVVPVHLGDGTIRYELADRMHHHHVVCTQCKSVADVHVPEALEAFTQQAAKQTRFTITRHSLEFFGVCAKCGV